MVPKGLGRLDREDNSLMMRGKKDNGKRKQIVNSSEDGEKKDDAVLRWLLKRSRLGEESKGEKGRWGGLNIFRKLELVKKNQRYEREKK